MRQGGRFKAQKAKGPGAVQCCGRRQFCRCSAQKGHQKRALELSFPEFAECQSCCQPGVASVCCDQGFLEKWVIFPLHVGLFHHFPFITRAQRLECQFFLITACVLEAYGERRDSKGKWQVFGVLNFLCASPLISEAKEICKCASGECWW